MMLRNKITRTESLLSQFRAAEQLDKDPAPLRRIIRPTAQLRIDSKSLPLKPHVMNNVSPKRSTFMGRKFVAFVAAPILCAIGLLYGQGGPSAPVSNDQIKAESISATIEKSDLEITEEASVLPSAATASAAALTK